MDRKGSEDEVLRRRDAMAARMTDGGDTVSLARWTNLNRLLLDSTGLSSLLLLRLHTLPQLRTLCYREQVGYRRHWGACSPEPTMRLAALERNPARWRSNSAARSRACGVRPTRISSRWCDRRACRNSSTWRIHV
jgi:hypothetical protein